MVGTCVLGFLLFVKSANPAITQDWNEAIAQNVCNAAEKVGIDPKILGAYMLTENRRIDVMSIKPAAQGFDVGLFHSNTFYQRDRPNIGKALHPFYGAEIAGNIVKENIAKYGWTWKAFAAYWNPLKAKNSDPQAMQYYSRWFKNYQFVEKHFAQAQQKISIAQIEGGYP